MQTNDLFNRFLEVLDELENENVDYVLIGGFAMVLYGMPRTTQDIDVFINNKKDNIDRLQKALFKVFNNKNVFEITFEELEIYPVIRYGSDEGFSIDVLSKLGTEFSYRDLKIESIKIGDHKIKIASVESLYKLKEKTLRAIDKNDLVFLKQLLKNKK